MYSNINKSFICKPIWKVNIALIIGIQISSHVTCVYGNIHGDDVIFTLYRYIPDYVVSRSTRRWKKKFDCRLLIPTPPWLGLALSTGRCLAIWTRYTVVAAVAAHSCGNFQCPDVLPVTNRSLSLTNATLRQSRWRLRFLIGCQMILKNESMTGVSFFR